MKTIMSNTFRLFIHNKGFITAITLLPVVLFLVMSLLLPYSEIHSIAVINKTNDATYEQAVKNIEGIAIQDIGDNEVSEAIISGIIELAVVIENDPISGKVSTCIISAGETEITGAVELALSQASDAEPKDLVSVSKAEKHFRNLNSTAPFMLFKFIESGSIFGAMMLLDRKRKLKERILLSGISSMTYDIGMTVVYLLLSSIGTTLYFLTAMIMDFDFIMRHSIHYLIMITLVNVLSASIYFFVSTFVNTESQLEAAATYPLEIMSFFSGLFFPFEYMPNVFRIIGSFSPQRWITHGIEAIQKSGTIVSALGDIVLILALSVSLYIIGIYRNRKKVVCT